MKKLIILRGISGSGKSTKAREIMSAHKLCFPEQGMDIQYCSADLYFCNSIDGKYQFDGRCLREAHQSCKDFCSLAMQENKSLIIIDNTNTQKWEYQPYLDMAKDFGYEVEVVMVGNLTDLDLYHSRNTHSVPREAIERMAKRFEK